MALQSSVQKDEVSLCARLQERSVILATVVFKIAEEITEGNWQVLSLLQFSNILMDCNGDGTSHRRD